MTTLKFGDIYLVHGNSLLDYIIRYWTRSHYNHGGIVINDNFGIEANFKGINIVNLFSYKNITYLTLVKPLTDDEQHRFSKFFFNSMGDSYNFLGIIGFLISKPWKIKRSFYCFEFIWNAYENIGRSLGRLDTDFIDAPLIFESEELTVIKT